MGNIIVEKIENWLFSIALKKGILRAVQFVLMFVTSVKVQPLLVQFGITLDPVVLEGALTSALMAGSEILRNFLKVKMGWSWL